MKRASITFIIDIVKKEREVLEMKKNLLKKIAAFSLIMTMVLPTAAFADANQEFECENAIKKYLWSNINVLEIFKEWHEQNINNVQKPIEKPEVDFGVNENDGTENENQNQDSTQNIGIYESQILQRVNEERRKVGLEALTYNAKLANVAAIKAADMRDNNYFSHTSPTYGSPFDMMKKFGIKYSSAGENIAKGQKTADAVMDAWMNSSGHRANILSSNYEQLGVGYKTDKNGNTYWVQMFIK